MLALDTFGCSTIGAGMRLGGMMPWLMFVALTIVVLSIRMARKR